MYFRVRLAVHVVLPDGLLFYHYYLTCAVMLAITVPSLLLQGSSYWITPVEWCHCDWFVVSSEHLSEVIHVLYPPTPSSLFGNNQNTCILNQAHMHIGTATYILEYLIYSCMEFHFFIFLGLQFYGFFSKFEFQLFSSHTAHP